MPLSRPAALIPGLVLWQWEHTLWVRSETYQVAVARVGRGWRRDLRVPNIRPQIGQSGSRTATARDIGESGLSIQVKCPST